MRIWDVVSVPAVFFHPPHGSLHSIKRGQGRLACASSTQSRSRLPQARLLGLYLGCSTESAAKEELTYLSARLEGPGLAGAHQATRESSHRLAMVVTIMIAVPVTIRVPLVVMTVPPSVIGVPAAFALGIQITAPLVSLVAAFAVLANRLVKLCFPVFDFTLTLRVWRIGICRWYGHYRRAQGHRHNCCYCEPFQSL
jgi:hypothetical protein